MAAERDPEGSDCEDPGAAFLGGRTPPRRARAPPPASRLGPPAFWCWNLCYGAVAGAVRLFMRLCRWLFCRKKPENLLLEESRKWEKRRCPLWSWLCSWIETDLPIQVRATGQTGDCEHQFLKEVSDGVSHHLIHLKEDDSSAHFQVVFCPVSSRVGTDMQGALQGLNSVTKAILVMLHHMPQESTRFVDTKMQAHHSSVVRTVHARYTLEGGLYASQVNREAVDDVAEIFKNHCREMRGGPRSLMLRLYLVVWGAITIMIAVKNFMQATY